MKYNIYDHSYRPPDRSIGIRMFAARSKSSVRGFEILELPADDHPRQVIFESQLERKTLLTLCALPEIWNVFDQPARITFEGFTGKTETHIPDYLAEYKSGLRVAVAVKPFKQVQKLNFRATLRAVEKSMPQSFADRLFLVTEKNLHPAEVRNAEFLSMCRRCKDREADDAVAQVISALSGEERIQDLVCKTRLNGRGFRAIFRAIYSGNLHADRRKYITPQSLVTVSEGPAC